MTRYPSISIHALRKESDLARPMAVSTELSFQSTLSVRRATFLRFGPRADHPISIHALRKESDRFPCLLRRLLDISIHALRKESDHSHVTRNHAYKDFNPRSP